jgi:hypothetical protein
MSVLEKPGHLSNDSASVRSQRWLLLCGVLYGMFYVVGNDVVAAWLYGEGYSRTDQAVSELSGTSADSQAFLRAMIPVFAVLIVAFGVGVWRAAHNRWPLRVVGACAAMFGVTSFLWLLFPMSSREDMTAGTTASNDVGHLAMAALTVVAITTMIGFGAVALRGWFRIYSLLSLAVVLAAGIVTGQLSADIAEGDPTPWLGLVERTSIGAWLAWMAVLAIVLMRERRVRADAAPVVSASRPG